MQQAGGSSYLEYRMPAIKSFISAVRRCGSFLVMAALLISTMATSPSLAEIKTQALSLNGQDAAVPTYMWSDAGVTPKAVLVALHGGVQHGRVFDPLARKLAPEGFIVYAIDFRGHGQWLVKTKKRPKVDYDGTVRDLIKVTEQLRAKYPLLPLYGVGESLGAAVTMKALSTKPKLFDGIILASAGVRPATRHHVSATFKSIGQGIATLGSTIDVTAHITGISDDKRSSDEMIGDPLGRRKSSVWSLLHTLNFLHAAHRAASSVDNVPVLVLQGEEDRIINPESTKELYWSLPAREKTLKTFPGVGHLLVTTQYLKDEVVTVVEDWLTAQVEHRLAVTAKSTRTDDTTVVHRSKP